MKITREGRGGEKTNWETKQKKNAGHTRGRTDREE